MNEETRNLEESSLILREAPLIVSYSAGRVVGVEQHLKVIQLLSEMDEGMIVGSRDFTKLLSEGESPVVGLRF